MRNDRRGEFRISRESWLRRSVSECRVIINQRVVLFIEGDKMSKGLFKCGTLAHRAGEIGGGRADSRGTLHSTYLSLRINVPVALRVPGPASFRFAIPTATGQAVNSPRVS